LLLRTLRAALLVLFVLPPLWCALYAVVPVGTTPLLVSRMISGKGLVRSPVPLRAIAPALRHAVIASEDQRFCLHHGFDWTEIERAYGERARRERGASTLSQQVAKNVFL
jgi:monofunctional biosynthetic peptidoglycan transglycosylase